MPVQRVTENQGMKRLAQEIALTFLLVFFIQAHDWGDDL